MDHDYPIYTIRNECQDCYKCVRHCPCKAIKVKDGSASVVPELCVACGLCYQVCPAGAKKIRSDLERARHLLKRKEKVYASIAPSWINYFTGVNEKQLAAAIKKLGFAGVGETALGAQQVSAKCAEILGKSTGGIFISSACPAAVDYIRKYLPEHTKNIVPVLSPLLSHCRMLKEAGGPDCGTVFFGPCIAKKHEADTHPELLDLALSFDDLATWMTEERLNPTMLATDPEEGFFMRNAEEGKLYPIEGGMLDTVRKQNEDDTVYLTLSGLQNIGKVLSGEVNLEFPDCKVFIECLACKGGCINGPVMKKNFMTLNDMVRIAKIRNIFKTSSAGREVEVPVSENIIPHPVTEEVPDENAITKTLASIGKYTKEDELNCGGCGYQTCRDFAKALIAGKAEPEMCVSHLKKLSQKKANALIKYIPAGVVIFDGNMKIIECNKHFAEMFGDSTMLAYEAEPGLKGVDIDAVLDFTDLFRAAMASGGELERRNFVYKDMILDIDIFSIEKNRVAGAIIQDVTVAELHREQIAEKAREVIQKNILAVQKIANCLGEHMADTEIILREVASGYDNKAAILKKEKKPDA